MPRPLRSVVRFPPPFGGLNLALAPRLLDPRDAREALNVHTARGGIEVREPMVTWSTAAALNPYYTAVKLFTFRLYTAPGTGEYIACHAITQPGGGGYRRELRIFDASAVYKGLGETVLAYESGNGQLGHAVLNDRLYLSSPAAPCVQKVLVLTTAFAAYDSNYQKPPDSAALLQSGGTLEIGVAHNYRHTYYNPNLNIEGPCSDNAAATPTSGERSIKVPYVPRGMTPPIADEATHVRIYRLKAGTDDHWYLIKTVARASVGGNWWWIDTGADVPPKLAADQVKLGAAVPPAAQLMCAHRDRMWYVPYGSPGEIWHSEYQQPGLVNPLNSYSIGDPAYGDAMLLISSGERLFILREDAVWVIIGDGPDSFVSERLYTGIGACGWFGAVETPDGLHVAHRTGIYRLGASGPELISREIGPLWETYGSAVRARISAAFDEKHELVVWNVPSSTTATQLVYNLRSGRWSTWNAPVWHVCSFQAADQGYRRPYGFQANPGTPNLRIVRMSPDTPWRDWDGTPMNWAWRTGRLDLGVGRPKKYYFLRASWDRTAVGQTVLIERGLNDDDTLSAVGTFQTDADPAARVFPLGATAEALDLRLSGTATGPTQITGLELEALPVGPR